LHYLKHTTEINVAQINLDYSRIERMASHGELNVREIELTVAPTGRDAEIRLHLHTSSGRIKGYPISGFPRDFFKEIDRAGKTFSSYAPPRTNICKEVDIEEIEETPRGTVSRSGTRRGIPSINALSGKGAALLRPGAPASTSEQNLSTQMHGLNEDNRRKSDEVVARATPEKAVRGLNLKSKFSKLSLRDEDKPPQQPETRPRSMEIPSRGIQRDKSPVTHGQEQQSSRHRRDFSTNSPPEQPQREREITSLHVASHKTGQHQGGYDTPYSAPDTNPRSFSRNHISPTSMPQPNPTPSPMSNPHSRATHPPTHTPQLPPAPTQPGFIITAAPSSAYRYYHADNAYSLPQTAAAQPRSQHTTPTFDDILRAPAQPGDNPTPFPLSNNPYYQPPSYEVNEKVAKPQEVEKADLELEFALQISLADQEEEQKDYQRRVRKAVEESQCQMYRY
jgi:hypothetical protein